MSSRSILRSLSNFTILVLLVLAGLWTIRTYQGISSNANRIRDLEQTNNVLAGVVEDARSQGADVPDPQSAVASIPNISLSPVTTLKGVQGEQGPRGLPGRSPTTQEIDAAVARRCLIIDCTIPESEIASAIQLYCSQESEPCRGQRGRAPTPDELATALAAFCLEGNSCQGPRGEQGPAGPSGQDGTAIISQEQANTAMSVWCSANQCIGPQGDQGVQGPVGQMGPSGVQGEQGERGPQGPAGQNAPRVVDVIVNCTQDSPVGPINCSSQVVYE